MISASRKAISSAHPMFVMLNRTHRLVVSRGVSASCQCQARQREASGVGEGPIPFSSSKAASWSMTKNVVLPERDVPRYQALSVGLSVSVFLIYFLFLREENDLDVELNTSLFDRVPQLEEHQLKVALEHSRSQNQDTKDLEDRLAQLRQSKQRASSS